MCLRVAFPRLVPPCCLLHLSSCLAVRVEQSLCKVAILFFLFTLTACPLAGEGPLPSSNAVTIDPPLIGEWQLEAGETEDPTSYSYSLAIQADGKDRIRITAEMENREAGNREIIELSGYLATIGAYFYVSLSVDTMYLHSPDGPVKHWSAPRTGQDFAYARYAVSPDGKTVTLRFLSADPIARLRPDFFLSRSESPKHPADAATSFIGSPDQLREFLRTAPEEIFDDPIRFIRRP